MRELSSKLCVKIITNQCQNSAYFCDKCQKMDFLAENNYCGQSLLKLVSRGNSTIAELFRLKDVIPNIYK